MSAIGLFSFSNFLEFLFIFTLLDLNWFSSSTRLVSLMHFFINKTYHFKIIKIKFRLIQYMEFLMEDYVMVSIKPKRYPYETVRQLQG